MMSLGCDVVLKPETKMVPNHVVQMIDAQTADVYLRMFSGNLIIGAKGLALMVGTYTYNNPIRVPIMTYKEIDKKGWLMVSQEEIPTIGSFARNDAMNQWDIQFDKKIPIELTIEFGKGRGMFDLNEVDLKRFKLLNRKGKLDIDLSTRILKDDLNLWINNEEGDISISLPKNVGIRVTTVRGADIVADGLIKENAVYKNELEGSDVKHIYLDIKSDAGAIIIRK